MDAFDEAEAVAAAEAIVSDPLPDVEIEVVGMVARGFPTGHAGVHLTLARWADGRWRCRLFEFEETLERHVRRPLAISVEGADDTPALAMIDALIGACAEPRCRVLSLAEIDARRYAPPRWEIASPVGCAASEVVAVEAAGFTISASDPATLVPFAPHNAVIVSRGRAFLATLEPVG